MIRGVRVLADASPVPSLALSLVAAHVLECTLKAYLSRDGSDSCVKDDPKVRHDLGALWSMANKQGLGITLPPPQWVQTLSHIHNSPYYLRYSTGIHGISTPGPEPMTTELQSLLDLVQTAVRL